MARYTLSSRITTRDVYIRKLRLGLQRALKIIGRVDNGNCKVCKIGYRKWSRTLPRPVADPCTNVNCPSHELERLLRVKTKDLV